MLLASMTGAKPVPVDESQIVVIDGDTIDLQDGGPSVRLVGFDTPETHRARCDKERAEGEKATDRLSALLRSAALEIQFVACACAPGTEGTQACNFGRRCAALKADGTDVGATLISEGLAAPYVCDGTKCPKRPDWCP